MKKKQKLFYKNTVVITTAMLNKVYGYAHTSGVGTNFDLHKDELKSGKDYWWLYGKEFNKFVEENKLQGKIYSSYERLRIFSVSGAYKLAKIAKEEEKFEKLKEDYFEAPINYRYDLRF